MVRVSYLRLLLPSLVIGVLVIASCQLSVPTADTTPPSESDTSKPSRPSETPTSPSTPPAEGPSSTAPSSEKPDTTAAKTPTREPPPQPLQKTQVQLDSYIPDELFAVDGGGCGMTLTLMGNPGRMIFFNGVNPESTWMKLNGRMVQFQRTAASGEAFYGQTADQTFVSMDGSTQVTVTVTLGAPTGPESHAIGQGMLQLQQAQELLTVPVAGDVGC